MADVLEPTVRRRRPFLDQAMQSLEKKCHMHDKVITNGCWILLLLIFWILFAELFVLDHTTYEYMAEYEPGSTAEVTTQMSKRTLHRVQQVMRERCHTNPDDIVLAPEVQVSGNAFMYRMLLVCSTQQLLVNPVIAVQGSAQGYCVDNYAGVEKRMVRSYPITVHSMSAAPVTYLDLPEICPVMAAIDALNTQG